MPNRFPGMDPYLEGDLWTTVHMDLCAEIARQLSPKLRPKYVALNTRRVVLARPGENGGAAGERYPDVGVLTSHPPSSSPAGGSQPRRSSSRPAYRNRFPTPASRFAMLPRAG